MNTTSPIISALALIAFAIASIIIAVGMKKHATSPKHKLALSAPLVLVAAIPVAVFSIDFDTRIAVFTVFGAFIIIGLIWLLTAVESAELYGRLRKDGGAWRWIVSESPKKESFVIRGWFLFLLGLAGLIMCLYKLS